MGHFPTLPLNYCQEKEKQLYFACYHCICEKLSLEFKINFFAVKDLNFFYLSLLMQSYATILSGKEEEK